MHVSLISTSDGSMSSDPGLGQVIFFDTRVGSGVPPLNLENFPQFFNFFCFGSKKSHWAGSKNTWVIGGSAPYLLQVKSMLRSGCDVATI